MSGYFNYNPTAVMSFVAHSYFLSPAIPELVYPCKERRKYIATVRLKGKTLHIVPSPLSENIFN